MMPRIFLMSSCSSIRGKLLVKVFFAVYIGVDEYQKFSKATKNLTAILILPKTAGNHRKLSVAHFGSC